MDNAPLMTAPEAVAAFNARFGRSADEQSMREWALWRRRGFRREGCEARSPRRCPEVELLKDKGAALTVTEMRAVFLDRFGWMPGDAVVRGLLRQLGVVPVPRRGRRYAGRKCRA